MLRKDVSLERIWATEDLLNEEELPRYFQDIKDGSVEISKFRGKLNKENAIDCLLTYSKINYKIEKCYIYIMIKGDENKSVAKYNELKGQIEALYVEFLTESSFIQPALAAFKQKDLNEMLKNPAYEYFTMFLTDIIREKKHLLSEKEEALLSGVGGFSDEFRTIFSMFDNVDVDFGEIDYHGEKVRLTHGLYSLCLQDTDANLRKTAYEQVYNGYMKMIHTVAGMYIGNVKKDYFYAKARKYSNCLESALYGENIPERVYNNLIEIVDKYAPVMHEYVAYRKKCLKLKELHMYDMYLPIVDIDNTVTEFDKAYDIVCDALAPLGEEYVSVLRQAKRDRWIDVEETENKKSGAYQIGAYGVHPYVLLNHKGTIHDVFTIAHEIGHAMHTYYANGAQCYEKANYSIFVAEIASTVNEVLMIKHMLKTAEGKQKKYLLSYYVDMLRTTLFRQTMFAEFEKFAHEAIENGEPLSYERMNEYYGELNKKYYGESVITDEYIKYEWARIPHFYTSFYVYKYATGITCAINIANMILNDASNVEKYKNFLKCGGSKYPMENLALVDIDLTKKTPFVNVMREFKSVLKELKSIK